MVFGGGWKRLSKGGDWMERKDLLSLRIRAG